jgi:hypothetical protein
MATHIKESADVLGSPTEAPLAQKLAELKKARFAPDGKEERIARSLAALNQEVGIRLSSEEWKRIIEDPELEDQF